MSLYYSISYNQNSFTFFGQHSSQKQGNYNKPAPWRISIPTFMFLAAFSFDTIQNNYQKGKLQHLHVHAFTMHVL